MHFEHLLYLLMLWATILSAVVPFQGRGKTYFSSLPTPGYLAQVAQEDGGTGKRWREGGRGDDQSALLHHGTPQ